MLRAALWDGTVDHQGRFITAKATSSNTPQVPVLVSALNEGAFRLAGEISDEAIVNCPPSYLLDVALPALHDAHAPPGEQFHPWLRTYGWHSVPIGLPFEAPPESTSPPMRACRST